MKKRWHVHGRQLACEAMGIITWIVFVIVPAYAAAGENVILFHAGSLTVPLAEIEKQFEAAHPEIDIIRKGGGSTRMARLIADQGMPADIMASADYQVIDKTLIPKNARWNIRFASNQLVLCYTLKSRYYVDQRRPKFFRRPEIS
jgi:molybdate/tungstate transport system substrate-binding protein